MDKKSSWLSAVCAFAIALGALGMCASIVGAANILFLDKFQQAVEGLQPQTGGGPGNDAAKKMNEEILQVTNRMKGLNITLAAGNFLISTLLLIGGIQALRMRPSGRSLLVGVCLAAAVFDVGQLISGLVMQQRMMEAQSRYVQEAMKSMPAGQQGGPAGMPAAMGAAMKIGAFVGMAFAIGWCLAKVAAYIAAFIYLRTPSVRSLYAEEPVFAGGPGNPSDDLAGIDDFGA